MEIISEINRLCDKYGDEFNWGIISESSNFLMELQKETDISPYNEVKAIARSYSSDAGNKRSGCESGLCLFE